MVRGPFEGFHLLEIREERNPNLGANRRHLLCREDLAPMFDRTDGVNSAVAYKPGYCVRPFICNEVDRVLESTGNAVMVFCCHKDKSIKALNLVRPALGILLCILALTGRMRFIEKRKIAIFSIDQLLLRSAVIR